MNIDYNRLVFRRQFLLTAKKIDGLADWNRHSVCSGEKILYVHPDLEVTVEETEGRRVVLMGFLLDWQNPELGNADIIRRLLEESEDFMGIVESTYELGGRFAIIYEDDLGCRIFHDAGGQREVYYHLGKHGVSCASNLPIIKAYLDAVENPDEDIQKLYNSQVFLRFKKQWVGAETIYKDTRYLKPNHALDVKSGEVNRYWPLAPLESKPVDEVVEKASDMLKGFMKAASLRKKIMLPVTAGWDSRLLLAASREISDSVIYFVIKFLRTGDEQMNYMDVEIPRRLLEKLGLEFHVIEASKDVDERFGRIFMENTAYSKESILPGIYKVFYCMFPDNLNISSHISEVIRNYKGDCKKHREKFYETCVEYDYKGDYYDNKYVKRTCENWIKEQLNFSEKMNIYPPSLMYWEEWLGWEASHRSETDIAIEEYAIMSCRNLMALLLSVPKEERNAYDCSLYKKLMKHMWPEVLLEPINPSFKRHVKGALVSTDWYYKMRTIFKNMKKERHL